MAWFELHQNLINHPKLIHLSSISGLDIDVCLARLIRLWSWALDYAEDGDLNKYDPGIITGAIGATPDFYDHLITSRWVDNDHFIHDWWDYAKKFYKVKYKHKPEKWNRIRELYEDTSKRLVKDCSNNPPSTSSKNRTHTYIHTKHTKHTKHTEHIYSFWNQQGITVHRKLTDARGSKINARLKDGYDVYDICEAICNYKHIVDSDDYYWSHKWTLDDFLNPKNLDKFMSDNHPFNNWLKGNGREDPKPRAPKPGDPKYYEDVL
jgi:hypothetical protein